MSFPFQQLTRKQQESTTLILNEKQMVLLMCVHICQCTHAKHIHIVQKRLVQGKTILKISIYIEMAKGCMYKNTQNLFLLRLREEMINTWLKHCIYTHIQSINTHLLCYSCVFLYITGIWFQLSRGHLSMNDTVHTCDK